jgi:hypothetical protein
LIPCHLPRISVPNAGLRFSCACIDLICIWCRLFSIRSCEPILFCRPSFSVGGCAAGWSSPCRSRVNFPLSIKARPGSSFGITVPSRKRALIQSSPLSAREHFLIGFGSRCVPVLFLVTGLSAVRHPRRLLCRSLFFIRWERPVRPELPVLVASVFCLRVEDTGSISFGCDSSVLLGTLIRWSDLWSSQ